MAKIVDLEKEIDSQIDELIATRDEIKDAISKVEDERLRTLLTMRYINGDRWEKIAELLCYEQRQIDVVAVSADLGHSVVSTTLNQYSHMFAEAQARTSQAIADALSFDDKSRGRNCIRFPA